MMEALFSYEFATEQELEAAFSALVIFILVGLVMVVILAFLAIRWLIKWKESQYE